jgi:hypothetical protein
LAAKATFFVILREKCRLFALPKRSKRPTKASSSFLPARPAVISRLVVLVPVVVQVVLARCPFTQSEQHFVKKLSKNCNDQGKAPIFGSWPNVFFGMF